MYSAKQLLNGHECLGVTRGNYKIFLLRAGHACDKLLQLIQQLSSASFKGDGYQLNEQLHIDPYNRLYTHLVLWDESLDALIGWQRFTKTAPIINNQGISGLYSNTLFNFTACMDEQLNYGFEMGRGCIHPDYKKTLAIAYLWGGILKYIMAEGDIKFIYGLMSIGGHCPAVITAYVVYFYSMYFSQNINCKVIPNVIYKLPEADLAQIKSQIKGIDFEEDYAQLVIQLKSYDYDIPAIVKHCMSFCDKEGTELLAVGVDEDFGGCVDLLSIAEVDKIKPANITGFTRFIKD